MRITEILENLDGNKKEASTTMEASSKGRDYNHLEDLVLFEGASGVSRAADILEQFATSKNDLSVKWDGKLSAYYGRDENGVFGFGTIRGWKQNDPSLTAEDIKTKIQTGGAGQSWRKNMGEALGRIYPLLEKSVPKDFRGYVKGDVLIAAPMSPKKMTKDGIQFTPNQVTYTVNPESELGRRVVQAEAGIALHTYYKTWGDTGSETVITDEIAQRLNTDDVLAMGQRYVSTSPNVDVSSINKIRAFVKKNGSAIDSIVEGRKGLADMYNILYTFNVQMSRQGTVDKISTAGLLEWLPTSKVSQGKQARIIQIVQDEGPALDAVFEAVNLIMTVKNNVIEQLDDADPDIKTTTGGMAGGEGYVSLASKTKLVPRHIWRPT